MCTEFAVNASKRGNTPKSPKGDFLGSVKNKQASTPLSHRCCKNCDVGRVRSLSEVEAQK